MKFTLVASLLTLSSAVIARPHLESRNIVAGDVETASVQIDVDFVSSLEKLFRDLDKPTSPAIVPRQNIDTRNDVNNGLCNDIIVIFARGTTQSGNLGSLGTPLINAIDALRPGKVIGQGVLPYPANVFGYLAGGSSEGANSMIALTSKAAGQCPNAKIVWGGYSQGAQVAHLAAARLPTNLYSRVAAIVLIGDPKNGQKFPGSLNGKQITLCNDGDLICEGLPLPFDKHSTEAYLPRLPEAARFVVARV